MTEVLKIGRGQHFQARGHSIFPIRTDPKAANNIFYLFSSGCNFFTSGFVYATLPFNRLTRLPQYKPFAKNLTNKRANNQILYKKRCIKEQVYVSAFSSLVKVSKTVFLV